jgi:hypothetical protein
VVTERIKIIICKRCYYAILLAGVAIFIPCHMTTYGCCPDGKTPASGPGMVGCVQQDAIPHGSCFESEFGCCPNGITPSRGPAMEGCENIDCQVSQRQ